MAVNLAAREISAVTVEGVRWATQASTVDNGMYLQKDFIMTKNVRYTATISSAKERGDNIILMGSPGAGKTTVGQIVANQLGTSHVDVDNDHLEKVWGMPVAQKLADLGSEGFLMAEGEALCQLHASNTLVSLSGSNPLHSKAMAHVQSMGMVVYLDVDDRDILERLERMKVNRIVGQNEGTPMSKILAFRKQYYEGNYDLRVICERQESQVSIADKVVRAVKSLGEPSGYNSTRQQGHDRGRQTGLNFSEVVLQGLAPDGGLYIPSQGIPVLSKGEWERLVDCSYQERALRILEKWIAPRDLHPRDLSHMIDKAYSKNFQHPSITPLTQLDEQYHILELFHGPTASFKDLALQLMSHFFSKAIHDKRTSGLSPEYLILVATSGDTGSAVLDGFKNTEGVNVIVLYPVDGVSEIQKKLMTVTDARNVHVAGVKSDFDFCQSAIKTIFKDTHFRDLLSSSCNVKLSAANSINWGRLLPQVVYHASAYLDLVQRGVIAIGEPVDMCIPTGNFGNILAAYYAKSMGIPYDSLISASNENNILTKFFRTGIYDMRNRTLRSTISPSIDILKSSNLERFIYHVTGNDAELVTKLFGSLDREGGFQVPDDVRVQLSSILSSDWATELQCLHTINHVFRCHNYLMDPHTAVAMDVARRFANPSKPMVIAATAHHNKFERDVLRGVGAPCAFDDAVSLLEASRRLGARPEMHSHLHASVSGPIIHETVCEANVTAIKKQITRFLS